MGTIKGSRKKRFQYVTILALGFIGIFVFLTLVSNRFYMGASFLVMAASFLPFMITFERRPLAARELVMIAVLAAVAAISRIPFASIPSVQPTTFVIIMAGLVFGGKTGFVVGAMAAFISNLFLGQGPWTPWQMYAWGFIGLCSGLFKNQKERTKPIALAIFGLISGILFGWVMNLWIVVGILRNFEWSEFLALYAASFYFDLAHGLTTAFLLLAFANRWIQILGRFQRKYGLLER